MTKSINKQVEAQGVKKLDSFKGFETLNSKELQEIEGGSWIGDAWNFMFLTIVRAHLVMEIEVYKHSNPIKFYLINYKNKILSPHLKTIT